MDNGINLSEKKDVIGLGKHEFPRAYVEYRFIFLPTNAARLSCDFLRQRARTLGEWRTDDHNKLIDLE